MSEVRIQPIAESNTPGAMAYTCYRPSEIASVAAPTYE